MLTILVFLFLFIVLDIAAMRWGFNSSDGPESKEWERRQQHVRPLEWLEAHPCENLEHTQVMRVNRRIQVQWGQ